MTQFHHPIAFKARGVKAILAGNQTETRRLAKNERCPFGSQGALLWVQECWAYEGNLSQRDRVIGTTRERLRYRATDPTPERFPSGGWQPSRDMMRWMSRITLRVRTVFVERLHYITEEGAKREGCASVEEFAQEWNFRHHETIWVENPLVWVIGFEVLKE